MQSCCHSIERLEQRTLLTQIFVTNEIAGTIGEYTSSGTTVNSSLVSGLYDPTGIAVSGADLFVTDNNGSVAEFTTSGATVNASVVSGLNFPTGVAVDGSDLFVTNTNTGQIGEYTTDGATVNASLVAGLPVPHAIAVSGSDIFVGNSAGTIGEYTTSGATVNAALASGLYFPYGIAVSGSDLFVAESSAGVIGEYTTSGAVVNASLVSGLYNPTGIALSGSDLFVASYGSENAGVGTIGEYTTSGVAVNASLVSGLNEPYGIYVQPTGVVGPASQLSFGPQSGDVTAGSTISPAITVDVEDADDNIVTSDTSIVALSIASGPAGGILSGTTTVSAQGGVATFSNLSFSEPGTYTLVAEDSTLSIASSMPIDVNAPVPGAPVVITNPISQNVGAGDTVAFSAAASGNPTPNVQWQVSTDGGNAFDDISGATSTNYSFTAAAGENGDVYQAVFTNSNGSATSSPAVLTVTSATANNPPDTAPLQLTGNFTEDSATQQWVSSGTVDIGLSGKPPVLEISGGTVTYDSSSIDATGVFTSLIGNLSSPLFSGNFDVPVGAVQTSSVNDDGSGSNVELAGIVPAFSELTFDSSGNIDLQGDLKLPDALGGEDLPVSGAGDFVVSPAGLSVAVAPQLNVNLEFGLQLGDGVTATITDMDVGYDSSLDQLKLQGEVDVDIHGASLTADLAGENFIAVSPQGVAINGELSGDNLDIELLPGIKLDSFDIQLDTIDSLFGVSLTFGIGSKTITGGVSFLGGYIDSVQLQGDNLQADLGGGFFLQKIGGELDHMAPTDPDPLTLSGEIGVSYGPDVTLSLPSALGGDFNAALLYVDGTGTFSTDNTFSLKATVYLVGDPENGQAVATGQATFDMNLDDDRFDMPVSLEALNNTVTYSGNLSNDPATGELNGFGAGTLKVLGVSLANATVAFQYDPQSLSDSYFEGWGSLVFGIGHFGERIDFTGRLTSIGASDLPPAPAATAAPADLATIGLVSNAGTAQTFVVPVHAAAILFVASWDNPVDSPLVQLQAPNGKAYTLADFSSDAAFSLPEELQSTTQWAVALSKPLVGNWTVSIPDTSSTGTARLSGFVFVAEPRLRVPSPTSHAESDKVLIRYTVVGADPSAHVALFADTNHGGFGGFPIAENLPARGDSFTWSPADVLDGTYSFYAEVEDSTQIPALAYAPGTIIHGTPVFNETITTTLKNSVLAGSKGAATITIVNSGTGTADGTGSCSLLLSSDTVASTTDPSIVTLNNLKIHLRPRAKYTFHVSFKLPTTSYGNYYLLAEITDPDGKVSSSATASTIEIDAPFVRLAGTMGPASKSGDTLTITDGGNIGEASELRGTLGFSINATGTQPAGGTFTGVIATMQLKAGKSVKIRLTQWKSILSSAAPGTYFLTVQFVDGNGDSGFAVSSTRIAL